MSPEIIHSVAQSVVAPMHFTLCLMDSTSSPLNKMILYLSTSNRGQRCGLHEDNNTADVDMILGYFAGRYLEGTCSFLAHTSKIYGTVGRMKWIGSQNTITILMKIVFAQN